MTLVQAIIPNPNIACRPGWCLEYVRNTFGLPAKYASATDQWNNAKFKHIDKNYAGLAVPIFFSMVGVPEGHVALKMPDGSVYSSSSPTSTTPVHHQSMTTMMNAYGGKLTYLGWSEDLADVRIVKEEEVITTANQVYYLRKGIYAEDKTVSATDPDVGKDYAKIAESYLDYANKNGVDYFSYKAKAEKTIADLKKQLAASTTDATAQDTNKQVNWLVATIKKIFNIQ